MSGLGRVLAPGVAAAILFTAASVALERAGYASWAFFGNLNASGPGAFSAFAQSIGALTLRIVGVLAVWAAVTAVSDGTRARIRAAPLAGTFVILAAAGAAAAALAVPLFGLSILAYFVFGTYAFACTAIGARAPIDAIVDSIRIAASHFGLSFRIGVIMTLAMVVSAVADAVSGGSTAAVFAGWLVLECAAAYTAPAAAAAYRQAS